MTNIFLSSNICKIKVSSSPSIPQKGFLPVRIMQSIFDDHQQDAAILKLLFDRISPPVILERSLPMLWYAPHLAYISGIHVIHP